MRTAGHVIGRHAFALILLLLICATAAGCGRERPKDVAVEEQTEEEAVGAFEEEKLTGRIQIDGSSTVAPFVTLAVERFRQEEPGVRISVGVSGTGGGLERFCRGEIEIANASRAIDDEEKARCEKKRIDYLELQVANDALSVVVNPENSWARCLTTEQLKEIWRPGSDIRTWRDMDDDFPDVQLTLYGPGTDSGTFDYFTEAIVGEEGSSRSDYTATEDDNVIVRGVSSQKGALGYLGLSYLEQNAKSLRGVEIDDGDGCVAPSSATVQDGSYKPLSRPLYVYVRADALERLEVDAFLQFILDNQRQIAGRALFVPLTQEQVEKAQATLEGAGTDVGGEG